ncbi:hypothetical protein [Demequina sp. NBRC 110054]|uniref:hypothetical protein n=1 Tax=Demequina sp. NBRC 110054 TaxID=1570343 RepID=UPI000A03AB2B|nr:hypothetical protein [Demequina sp. NBRC 110054]
MTMTDASWRRLAGIVALGAVVGAGWYLIPRADSTTAVPIDAVYGRAASESVEITFDDCNRDSEIDVTETDSSVTLTVRLDWTTKIDCTSHLTSSMITLDEDLGERLVFDGSSELSVDVQTPPQ